MSRLLLPKSVAMLQEQKVMPGTDTIAPEEHEDEDVEASKKLLTTASSSCSKVSNESPGCLIDAKPPENIKHLIAKDDATTTK